jgi:hypothetical protein
MSLNFAIADTCPRCRKPIRLATIKPHPTRPDEALHSLECADCGPVKTKVLPLRPGGPLPELAA